MNKEEGLIAMAYYSNQEIIGIAAAAFALGLVIGAWGTLLIQSVGRWRSKRDSRFDV